MLIQDGYDLTVGTSEHGSQQKSAAFTLKPFKHILVAFGGPAGLEDHFRADTAMAGTEPKAVFDMYVNTCSEQGSRTIRTEEAVLISLTYLQDALRPSQ